MPNSANSYYDRGTRAPSPVVFETAQPQRPIGFGREDERTAPRIHVVQGITAQDLEDWRRQRERPAR
jgi:hypothetical protein